MAEPAEYPWSDLIPSQDGSRLIAPRTGRYRLGPDISWLPEGSSVAAIRWDIGPGGELLDWRVKPGNRISVEWTDDDQRFEDCLSSGQNPYMADSLPNDRWSKRWLVKMLYWLDARIYDVLDRLGR